jgi:hypothetical protein
MSYETPAKARLSDDTITGKTPELDEVIAQLFDSTLELTRGSAGV